ncbi:MAG: hypothetical protein RMJ33_08425 [Saprospiraceae bacterium]|nr:hypothetical protein [Saprospiraceae bacterium]MDW8229849.1 hypothetical protein [Saprospiraceae bacterium]
MLAFFRNNESFTVFWLAAYLGALRLPALLGWVAPPEGEEAPGGWLYLWLLGGLGASPLGSAIAAAGLVFVQAFMVNRLTDKYRMMEERTWLPGMLYGLVASCVPDFLFLSPALVATTFLPLGLWQIFSVYRRPLAFSAIFDTAVWFTMASLFYPPASWFVPVGFLSFFALRSFNRREQMVYVAGALAILIIVQAALFWYDRLDDFWTIQLAHFFAWPQISFPQDLSPRLSVGALGVLLLIAALGFNLYYYKRAIQVKKYIDILYWFFLTGTLSAFFRPADTLDGFLLCMPSVGIFLGYLFQSSRNNPFLELFHLALFALALVVQFSGHLF